MLAVYWYLGTSHSSYGQISSTACVNCSSGGL